MRLKLKENKTDRGVPLTALVEVNQALNVVLKASYRSLAGVANGKPVPEFKLYAKKFDNGSFITELSLDVSHVGESAKQMSFVLAAVDPAKVFEVAKNVFKFMSFLARKKNEGINVIVNVAEGSTAVVISGNNISVGDTVINTASTVANHGKRMLAPLRNGDLSRIELGSGMDEMVVLNRKDGDCFRTAIETDAEIKSSIGDVIEFHKKNRTGTFLYIEQGSELKHQFKLANNILIGDAIDSMKRSNCRLYYKEQFIQLPNEQRAVVSLNALRIEEVVTPEAKRKKRKVQAPK
jgi:hypothetical protein